MDGLPHKCDVNIEYVVNTNVFGLILHVKHLFIKPTSENLFSHVDLSNRSTRTL